MRSRQRSGRVRWLGLMAAVLAAVLGGAPAAAAADREVAAAAGSQPPFPDLSGHWAAPVVALLHQMGIIPAAPAFEPGGTVPDHVWAQWLCAATAWPGAPACAAVQQGAPISRGGALAAAAEQAPTTFVAEPVRPGDIRGHSLEQPLQRALQAGLVRGYPDGTLQPDRPLTRAEAAIILGRLLVNRHEPDPWHLEPDRQTPLDQLRLRLHPELAGPHRYLRVQTADGRTVAHQVRVAETLLQRTVGAESGLGDGLLLTATQGIHTRWGPVPLDVLFLDGDGRVTAVYTELPRDATAWGGPATASALELPGGTIERLGIRAGDQLRLWE